MYMYIYTYMYMYKYKYMYIYRHRYIYIYIHAPLRPAHPPVAWFSHPPGGLVRFFRFPWFGFGSAWSGSPPPGCGVVRSLGPLKCLASSSSASSLSSSSS